LKNKTKQAINMVMNSWIGKVVATILLVLTAVFLYGRFGPGIPVQSVVTQKNDLFTVSGEGKVTVVPDTGIVDLGITTNRPTVRDAQTQANTVIANITKAVKDLGVEDRDIKTNNYSVFPQYDFRDGNNRITGYQVTAILVVTVRDIDKVNQVIDQATASGANTVGGIQLTVAEEKQKELLHQAREMAVKEARDKATSLANAAGISLGKIVNVVEEPRGRFPGPQMMDLKAANAQGAGGATEIQPGSTDITTFVTLYYETR
jgi:uncharacterized protein